MRNLEIYHHVILFTYMVPECRVVPKDVSYRCRKKERLHLPLRPYDYERQQYGWSCENLAAAKRTGYTLENIEFGDCSRDAQLLTHPTRWKPLKKEFVATRFFIRLAKRQHQTTGTCGGCGSLCKKSGIWGTPDKGHSE